MQVLDECQAALGWLEEKKGLQETMKKTDDPVLVTADIKKKEETLTRVAEPILNKPPPKKVKHLVGPLVCYPSWGCLHFCLSGCVCKAAIQDRTGWWREAHVGIWANCDSQTSVIDMSLHT